ncbi:MAG: DsbA family oxidoreductase, partial [Candidatus Heimdallarchaeota archaeon]|nr:DsbA family oxidoreductase [Candidatus Heimdallarchaeota archaeon]
MNIEFFHDLICPWCRIGTQNLNEALSKWDGDPVTVQYRTFLLHPGTPEGGVTFNDYMKAKGAEDVKYEDFIKPIVSAGDKVGLNFNFDALGNIANTTIGHRFLHIIPDETKSDALDALHTAYFEDGKDISDIETLLGIAKKLTLNVETLKNELNGESGKQETLMDFYYAMQIGIKGVPMLIFDNKAVLYGTHP